METAITIEAVQTAQSVCKTQPQPITFLISFSPAMAAVAEDWSGSVSNPVNSWWRERERMETRNKSTEAMNLFWAAAVHTSAPLLSIQFSASHVY